MRRARTRFPRSSMTNITGTVTTGSITLVATQEECHLMTYYEQAGRADLIAKANKNQQTTEGMDATNNKVVNKTKGLINKTVDSCSIRVDMFHLLKMKQFR